MISENYQYPSIIGMALTEKQGGSNLCEYVTTAFCDNSVEKRFILTGHKLVFSLRTKTQRFV